MAKATIKDLKRIIEEMVIAQREHPKATVYYHWKSMEIMITYQLPIDFTQYTDNDGIIRLK